MERDMGFNPTGRCNSLCPPTGDHSLAGLYFVTLCTYKRRCLLGDMVDGELQLSKFGACVESAWREIPGCHSNVRLDAFVVMPNHLHGIVSLSCEAEGEATNCFPAVREIVHAFKARCAFYLGTNGCLETNGCMEANACAHSIPVWQRNHHEHAIRDEKSYLDIVRYIENEPQQWQRDIYNVPRSRAMFHVPLASASGLLTRGSPAGVSYG